MKRADATTGGRNEEQWQRRCQELQQRVAEQSSMIETLLGRVIEAQEGERRRIARDLHDQLGQQMTALRLNLEILETTRADTRAWAAQIARTQGLAEALDRSLSFCTWNCREPDVHEFGLPAALLSLVSGWSEQFGIGTHVDVCRDLSLGRDLDVHLYRLIQEALHNIVKHAHATRVCVLLRRSSEETVLTIEDNGRGFDPGALSRRVGRGGEGLANMRERAALIGGALVIEPAPAGGTTIRLRVPTASRPKRTALTRFSRSANRALAGTDPRGKRSR